MRKITGLIVLLLAVTVLCGCAKYQEKDFLGKTSAQIVLEYGEFDCIGKPADADGLYRNTSCGYTVRESAAGFLSEEPELLFFIFFDESGVAQECKEGYRPGG